MDTTHIDADRAHNARIMEKADEACRQYYRDNPDGCWEEAFAIWREVLKERVSIADGSYAIYR